MGMIRGRSVQTHGEIIPAQRGWHAPSALNVPVLILIQGFCNSYRPFIFVEDHPAMMVEEPVPT